MDTIRRGSGSKSSELERALDGSGLQDSSLPNTRRQEGFARSFDLVPRRDFQGDRDSDGGGPFLLHTRHRDSSAHECPWLVGTLFSSRPFSITRPHIVGDRWCLGLVAKWFSRAGSRQAQHCSPDGGPGLHRQRKLDLGTRTGVGITPAIRVVPASRPGRVGERPCVFEVVGCSVRSGHRETQGGGRVRETHQARCQGRSSAQRADRHPRRSSASAQAQGQGKVPDVNHACREEQRRNPGSAAPPLHLPSLIHALPRICLRAGGPFASFLRSSLCIAAECRPTPYTWPCPNPYPDAFQDGASGPALWKKRLIASTVVQLSFLTLGQPTSCPDALQSGVPLNPKQWKAVRGLEHLVFGSVFPFTFEASDYGRIGQKLEDQSKTIDALARAAASLCTSFSGYSPFRPSSGPSTLDSSSPPVAISGELQGKPPIAAMPITADRVKLPAEPAFHPEGMFFLGHGSFLGDSHYKLSAQE